MKAEDDEISCSNHTPLSPVFSHGRPQCNVSLSLVQTNRYVVHEVLPYTGSGGRQAEADPWPNKWSISNWA